MGGAVPSAPLPTETAAGAVEGLATGGGAGVGAAPLLTSALTTGTITGAEEDGAPSGDGATEAVPPVALSPHLFSTESESES